MEKVAFVCFNHSNRYSGGRIHALYLAKAFAKIGYEVDFYTNAKPVFYDETVSIFGDRNFNLCINKWFLWKAKSNNYKHIIFPPHAARRKFAGVVDKLLIYPFICNLKKKSGAKLWLLDFESPEWKSEVDERVLREFKHVLPLVKEMDVILSTTKTGRDYAKKYYGRIKQDFLFKQLYLCINSRVGDSIGYQCERKDRAVVFYRSGQMHKNNEAIFNMIKSLPSGFTLLLIGKTTKKDESFFYELRELAKSCEVKIIQEERVNEQRKYELLATSRLLLFSSKFEGYGLPPVEAQYVGTPVVCSDLPVLREVNQHAVFVDFSNVDDLKSAIIKAMDMDHKMLHDAVSSFASVESFCTNLQKIVLEIHEQQ